LVTGIPYAEGSTDDGGSDEGNNGAHAAAIKNSNSDKMVILDKGVSNSNGIQGSEESCSQEQQQSAMTNNSIF
jgi:hypothetical protein